MEHDKIDDGFWHCTIPIGKIKKAISFVAYWLIIGFVGFSVIGGAIFGMVSCDNHMAKHMRESELGIESYQEIRKKADDVPAVKEYAAKKLKEKGKLTTEDYWEIEAIYKRNLIQH